MRWEWGCSIWGEMEFRTYRGRRLEVGGGRRGNKTGAHPKHLLRNSFSTRTLMKFFGLLSKRRVVTTGGGSTLLPNKANGPLASFPMFVSNFACCTTCLPARCEHLLQLTLHISVKVRLQRVFLFCFTPATVAVVWSHSSLCLRRSTRSCTNCALLSSTLIHYSTVKTFRKK